MAQPTKDVGKHSMHLPNRRHLCLCLYITSTSLMHVNTCIIIINLHLYAGNWFVGLYKPLSNGCKEYNLNASLGQLLLMPVYNTKAHNCIWLCIIQPLIYSWFRSMHREY